MAEAWKARNSFQTNLSFRWWQCHLKIPNPNQTYAVFYCYLFYSIHWSWCHCLCGVVKLTNVSGWRAVDANLSRWSIPGRSVVAATLAASQDMSWSLPGSMHCKEVCRAKLFLKGFAMILWVFWLNTRWECHWMPCMFFHCCFCVAQAEASSCSCILRNGTHRRGNGHWGLSS